MPNQNNFRKKKRNIVSKASLSLNVGCWGGGMWSKNATFGLSYHMGPVMDDEQIYGKITRGNRDVVS